MLADSGSSLVFLRPDGMTEEMLCFGVCSVPAGVWGFSAAAAADTRGLSFFPLGPLEQLLSRSESEVKTCEATAGQTRLAPVSGNETKKNNSIKMRNK